MKAKLTVTIDEELIPEAKEQARSQGLSLSDLIEGALRGLTLEKRQSFSARWRGGFKAARRKDDRYRTSTAWWPRNEGKMPPEPSCSTWRNSSRSRLRPPRVFAKPVA